MLIVTSGLVCENGCGRIVPVRTDELDQLRQRHPHSVIRCTPVSQMILYSY